MTAVFAPRPVIQGFYDSRTFSIQYVVSCLQTRRCAIIDPVLDYDEKSGSIKTDSADAIINYVANNNLVVRWILDTHPHADHFTAARYLRNKTGAPTALGECIVDVQKIWKQMYNLSDDFPADGSQWNRIFADDEIFKIGNLEARAIYSLAHTRASITYLVGDAAFIHDTLFMPDSGSARADFPGGDATSLWRSIQRILTLPDETRLFTGHDYQPGGRDPLWESTVAEQKTQNLHLAAAKNEEEFVAIRQTRAATLPMPKLILHALQVNIRGGELPAPEDNSMVYLKIPLSALDPCKW